MRGLVGELRSEEQQATAASTAAGAFIRNGGHATGDLFAAVHRMEGISSVPFGESLPIADQEVLRSLASGAHQVIGTLLFGERGEVFGFVGEQVLSGAIRRWYIPLVAQPGRDGESGVSPIPRPLFVSTLRGLLRSGTFITHDLKTQLRVLAEQELCAAAAVCIREHRCDDLMLAGYCLLYTSPSPRDS